MALSITDFLGISKSSILFDWCSKHVISNRDDDDIYDDIVTNCDSVDLDFSKISKIAFARGKKELCLRVSKLS